jgi:hypothetical protein
MSSGLGIDWEGIGERFPAAKVFFFVQTGVFEDNHWGPPHPGVRARLSSYFTVLILFFASNIFFLSL